MNIVKIVFGSTVPFTHTGNYSSDPLQFIVTSIG